MKIKRGVWIAGALTGVAVFGALAILTGYSAYVEHEERGVLPLSSIQNAVVLILMAAASAGAMFFSPRDIEAVTKDEVDEDPAQWIEDMRQEQGAEDEPR